MNIIDTIRVSGTDYTLSATSSGGTEAVEVTQAEYDALVSGGTVDPTVFYIITDATPVDMSQYWTSAQTNSAINAAVSGKVETSAITSAVTSASTDSEIPTAKAVYDAIPQGGGGKAVSGGTNISITTGETADTINCTLPYFKVSDTYNYTVYGESHPYLANKATYAFQTMFIGNQNEVIGSNPSRGYTSNSVIGYKNKINSSSVNDYSIGYNVVIGDNNSLSGTKLSYSYVIGSKNSGYTSNTLLTGWYNQAYNGYESVLGKYNVSNTGSTDADKSLFSVGNGTAENARHNAFEIRQNGDIYLTLNGQDVKLQDQLGGGGGGGKAVSGGTNISITTGTTADTINCTVPASASSGNYSIMFGQPASSSDASGAKSMTGGQWSKAYSEGSVAIGQMSESRSPWAWAIGNGTRTDGKASFACCNFTRANANYAFSEGTNTTANTEASHSAGSYTSTKNRSEFSIGEYNNSVSASTTFGDSGNTLFSVGNGTADNARHNAFEIRQNGDIYFYDGTNDVKLQDKFSSLDTTIGNINTILESI